MSLRNRYILPGQPRLHYKQHFSQSAPPPAVTPPWWTELIVDIDNTIRSMALVWRGAWDSIAVAVIIDG